MIKLIIFDYFGVIGSDDYWDFIGENKDDEGRFHALDDEANLGRIKWREFVERLADTTDHTIEEVNEMYQRSRINREVVGYIVELKKHYKVALLSNAHHDYLEPLMSKAGIRDLFDDIFISSRLGMIKPAREIFEVALSSSKVKADEAARSSCWASPP